LKLLIWGHRTMSLFGKILAVLNIFGAIGLIVVASMDYAKRQAWAQAQFQLDLILEGLPLDEQQRTSNDERTVDLLGEEPLRQLFAAAGGSNPVRTQVEEVGRVQRLLDGQLQPLQGNVQAQTHLLAVMLLPLADNSLDREHLLSCRSWLATPELAATHKRRYLAAFREATRPPAAGEEPKPFDEAFRTALRLQGGLPSELFTSMLLKALSDDPKKAAGANIDATYDSVLQAQRQMLDNRLKELFVSALQGPSAQSLSEQGQAGGGQGQRETASRNQRMAIARLIFGLCTFMAQEALKDPSQLQAEPALQGVPPGSTEFAIRLVSTKAYQAQLQRCLVVCGLRDGLDAISERTGVLRRMNDYLVGTMSDEEQLFVADHAHQIEEIKKRAALLQMELAQKSESERKLALQQELVKKRQSHIKLLEDEYKDLRAKTAEKATELAKLSESLLEDRVKARDLIRKTEETYQVLRNLEGKLRELENKR
jgi:hypothetical protein